MKRCRVDRVPPKDHDVALPADAAHHLTRVMRLGEGARIRVFDGQGRQADARLRLDPVRAEVVSEPQTMDALAEVHLVLALLKGPAMDLAVRAATEAGATHIHVVQSARSVPKGTKADRWTRIITSAAAQSGRADVPTLGPPQPLAKVLEDVSHIPDRRICLPGSERGMPATTAVAVLVGPEGGWTPAEVQLALDTGCMPMGLGRWVLRASTAAPVAVALAAAR